MKKLDQKEKWLLKNLLNDICYNWRMMNNLITKESKNFYYRNILIVFMFIRSMGVSKRLIDKAMEHINKDYLGEINE